MFKFFLFFVYISGFHVELQRKLLWSIGKIRLDDIKVFTSSIYIFLKRCWKWLLMTCDWMIKHDNHKLFLVSYNSMIWHDNSINCNFKSLWAFWLFVEKIYLFRQRTKNYKLQITIQIFEFYFYMRQILFFFVSIRFGN